MADVVEFDEAHVKYAEIVDVYSVPRGWSGDSSHSWNSQISKDEPEFKIVKAALIEAAKARSARLVAVEEAKERAELARLQSKYGKRSI